MISKKFTFLDVGNQATFLGNIKESIDALGNAGEDYGWTIDYYTSGDDGLIMCHSNGVYGNQNLFYSIKLWYPNSGCSAIHLCGQTDYDELLGYDAQPGKFTLNPNGFAPGWDGTSWTANVGNWVRTPTKKQVVFVNKQFIMVFWQEEIVLRNGNAYPVWKRMFIGAMDSMYPETETCLNWVDESLLSNYGWFSSPFMGPLKYFPYCSNYSSWTVYPRPTVGLLFKQPFDSTPVNKEFYNVFQTSLGTSGGCRFPIRWMSSIRYADVYNYYAYYSSSGYVYGSYSYSTYTDLITNYHLSVRYNTGILKHVMHRPICFLYEYIDSANIFNYPFAYLPYYAVTMSVALKGDDVISYGTRNFSVYPTFRDGNTYGIALEYIEG